MNYNQDTTKIYKLSFKVDKDNLLIFSGCKIVEEKYIDAPSCKTPNIDSFFPEQKTLREFFNRYSGFISLNNFIYDYPRKLDKMNIWTFSRMPIRVIVNVFTQININLSFLNMGCLSLSKNLAEFFQKANTEEMYNIAKGILDRYNNKADINGIIDSSDYLKKNIIFTRQDYEYITPIYPKDELKETPKDISEKKPKIVLPVVNEDLGKKFNFVERDNKNKEIDEELDNLPNHPRDGPNRQDILEKEKNRYSELIDLAFATGLKIFEIYSKK